MGELPWWFLIETSEVLSQGPEVSLVGNWHTSGGHLLVLTRQKLVDQFPGEVLVTSYIKVEEVHELPQDCLIISVGQRLFFVGYYKKSKG